MKFFFTVFLRVALAVCYEFGLVEIRFEGQGLLFERDRSFEFGIVRLFGEFDESPTLENAVFFDHENTLNGGNGAEKGKKLFFAGLLRNI